MRSPGSEIITTVNTDTTSLSLSLNLVLAKQIKPVIFAHNHITSMCIDKVSIRVGPSASWNDILGLDHRGKQQV